jgi:hypothetical protein
MNMPFKSIGVWQLVLLVLGASAGGAEVTPRWTEAAKDRPPMTVDQAKAFIHRLATYAIGHHMKRDEKSPQRGMMYEYFDVARQGQFDQFVEGEALDTMHDGAWFALAMVTASRATGDPFYQSVLTDWQLPFYCKMLNHSDELFNSKANHARPQRQNIWKDSRETLLKESQKGFVPYWWDDGGSVSLERLVNKSPLPDFPAYDDFAARGLPNPKYILSGYSLGSSNHMAQDLGVMLEGAWLLLRDDPKWNKELAEAAQNLQQCRASRGYNSIPAVLAPAAISAGDANRLARLPDPGSAKLWEPDNHYTRALYTFKPSQKYSVPGFADDDEYSYYAGIARAGGKLPTPLAFKLIYDAYTQPMLYRFYCDDAPPLPGINRFDLHPYDFIDGKPADYRSDRKGPGKMPRPTGSRFGPQNMAVTGWALQILKDRPGIWEARRKQFPKDTLAYIGDPTKAAQENEQGSIHWAEGMPVQGFFVARRDRMYFCVMTEQDPLTITIHNRPDGQGTAAIVTIKRDGSAEAHNDKGEKLIVQARVLKEVKGFTARINLPYTVTKGQGTWGTVIEHSRFSIKIGDVMRNFYFVSPEIQVKQQLERELAGGLRTWEAIFDELGYIPTGMGEARWQKFSDTGGYAHLIQAASQWILFQDGKRDWEMHHFPAVH